MDPELRSKIFKNISCPQFQAKLPTIGKNPNEEECFVVCQAPRSVYAAISKQFKKVNERAIEKAVEMAWNPVFGQLFIDPKSVQYLSNGIIQIKDLY